MSKALDFWDRVMFGALLILIIFIPYSAAMTQGCIFIMIIAWVTKHTLVWKSNPRQEFIKSFSFPSQGLSWPLFVIGLLIVLTVPFSHDPALSLKKFFSRFLQQIFLMYCVSELIRTPKRLYQVLVVFLWTLIVVNADVLVQFLRGHSFIYSTHMLDQRVTGPMRHSNDLGSLLVTVLPIILSLMLTRHFWIPLLFGKKPMTVITVIGWILFLCSVISLGLTASRGAWIAFAITMLGWSVFLKNYRLTGFIVLTLAVFFGIFGARCMNVRTDISPRASVMTTKSISIPKETSTAQNNKKLGDNIQLNTVYNTEKVFLDSSRRFEYWHTAQEVIKRYPLFGCGYNAYIQTLKKLKLNPEEYPHNSLLHITAELGLIGLIAYLSFFIALFLKGKNILSTIFFHKDLYILGVGICFGLLAWLIHSFLDTPWESLLLNILWWLLIGILLSLRTVSQQFNLHPKGD